MDRSWMNKLRTSKEYGLGVEGFLEFAKRNAHSKSGMYFCPYVKCINQIRKSIDDIRDDLICYGINLRYRKWVWHGELGITTPSSMSQSVGVVAFLSMNNLDLGWLELAIQYFHLRCCNEGFTEYAFLSPMSLVRNTTSKEKEAIKEHNNIMEAYAGFQISSCRKRYYFAPILDGGHWILCVICPEEHHIYWFDSLDHEPHVLYKKIFTKAILHWHITLQTHLGAKRKIEIVRPTCPQQPGNTECGYYVIRYVYDILMSGLNGGLSNIYDGEEPFDQDAIDEIRDKLSAMFLQHYMD